MKCYIEIFYLFAAECGVSVLVVRIEEFACGVQFVIMYIVCKNELETGAVFCRNDALFLAYERMSELCEKFESIVGRFFYAVFGEKPVSAVEKSVVCRKFVYVVRKTPLAEGIASVKICHNIACHIRSLKCGIVQKIFVGCGGIPFGKINGEI